METEIETETETEKTWIQEEAQALQQESFDGERKPALKLEENKVITIIVDFSEPFKKWTDPEDNKTIKKILPVKVGAVDLVWWLNVKNPVYAEIIKRGAKGQTEFKILQTGSKASTKYNIVEE